MYSKFVWSILKFGWRMSDDWPLSSIYVQLTHCLYIQLHLHNTHTIVRHVTRYCNNQVHRSCDRLALLYYINNLKTPRYGGCGMIVVFTCSL